MFVNTRSRRCSPPIQIALILLLWAGVGNLYVLAGPGEHANQAEAEAQVLPPLGPAEGRAEGESDNESPSAGKANLDLPSPQPARGRSPNLLASSEGRGSKKAPPTAVQRWQDAKFGIFIHFGPWSQTANGLIWSMTMTDSAKQRERDLNLYKTFNPTHFNADEWARAIRRSGAKYAVFTTKHHDGFCNFDTVLTDARITSPECPYSSGKSRDITREFVRAMRAQKMMTGLYYSNVDWRRPDGVWHSHAKFDESFPCAHPDRWRHFVDFEKGQVRELLTHYGPIDLFWFDVWWPRSGQRDAVPMLRMMRQFQPQMLINDRGTDGFADFVTAEQGIPTRVPSGPWEACFTISEGNGFWYKGPDAKYKSAPRLIRLLADVASKGGNLLLSIGPKPDGSLVEQEVQRMNEIGDWLSRNGQAIYGTTRSPLGTVPDWGRVTRRGSRLYLIVFDWPGPGTPLRVEIPGPILAASLPGNSAPIRFRQIPDGSAIELSLPAVAPDPVASVVQLDMADGHG